jgi:hypothetical protein
MPQIVVLTDAPENSGTVVYREKIACSNMDSEHFSTQLLERVGWAVDDADALEHEAILEHQALADSSVAEPFADPEEPVRLEAALQPAVSG